MSRAVRQRRAQDPERIILHGRIEIGALEEWFTPFERKVRRLLNLSSDGHADHVNRFLTDVTTQFESVREALHDFRLKFAEGNGTFRVIRDRHEFAELWRRSEILKARIDALERQYSETRKRIGTVRREQA